MSRLIDADKLECVSATIPHEASEDYKQGYLDGFSYSFEIIDEQPTIDPVKNKLQRALDGKTEEEIYDILDWLMFDYAKQYTDSRSAVIQWLKEDSVERGGR